MPIIEIRKLTKKYNDTVVLNDINASFEKGWADRKKWFRKDDAFTLYLRARSHL